MPDCCFSLICEHLERQSFTGLREADKPSGGVVVVPVGKSICEPLVGSVNTLKNLMLFSGFALD